MKPSTAEYWLLKEVSNLDTFGQEMFHNTKFGYNGVSMIGVGPHGITVYRNRDEETQKYVERQQTIETSCSNLILEKLGESNKHGKNTGITRIAHSYLRFIPYQLFTTAYNNVFFFVPLQHTVHGDTECNVPTSNVPFGLSFPRWRGDVVKFQIRFESIRQRFVSCHHREARVLQLRNSEERGHRPIHTRFEGIATLALSKCERID